MMKYRVRANKGFVSAPMDWAAALEYGEQLKRLGNVNVEVVPA